MGFHVHGAQKANSCSSIFEKLIVQIEEQLKMGLHGDFEEISKNYRKLGPIGKILSVATFIISVSSITSLSDLIFNWKGFILQAVATYREYLVAPVIIYARTAGLQYDPDEIHAATLLSIAVVVGMRILAIGQEEAFGKISQRYNNEIRPNLMLYRFLAVTFPMGAWLAYGLTDDPPKLSIAATVFIMYPLFIIIPQFIMNGFKERKFYETSALSYLRKYYIYVGAVFLTVGLLGAVNLGLTRVS